MRPLAVELQQQAGLYVQDQLKLGQWQAILGLRQDWLSRISELVRRPGCLDEKLQLLTLIVRGNISRPFSIELAVRAIAARMSECHQTGSTG